MIVCHCNHITSDQIEQAVGCMLKNDCAADLCPAKVYGEVNCCPKCCNCFPLAEKVISKAASNHHPIQAVQISGEAATPLS